MSTHKIPFSMKENGNHSKLSQICNQGIFSLRLKNEFETAVVNEPPVFDPLKFYCSCNSVSFIFQDYSFQCYFRQRWFDNRLRFDIRNITEVTLNNLFLSHIWKPNTYFLNGQRSNQHNITVPNLFVRIREDGRVYLSRRLETHFYP